MDVGPTLAKGHPQSLDHGCNVRSTCRCSVYPAIHTTTRSLLRSSSTHEPSDPPLRVVFWLFDSARETQCWCVWDRETRESTAKGLGEGCRPPRDFSAGPDAYEYAAVPAPWTPTRSDESQCVA